MSEPRPLSVVRFETSGGDVRLGRLAGDDVVDVGPADEAGFVPTPESWAEVAERDGERHATADVRLLAPVLPGKIVCVGLNYVEHARESGAEIPQAPLLFAKFPSAGPQRFLAAGDVVTIGVGDAGELVSPVEERRIAVAEASVLKGETWN